MNTVEEILNDVLVISLEGRLDSNTSPQFEQEIFKRLDEVAPRLVIDFTRLEYISSAGLRVILMVAKKIKADNGSFGLCCLSETVREVFQISGFLSILSTFDSRDEAVKVMT